MGKYGNEYERPDKDLFPTPAWVTEALAEHVDLAGRTIWEPAAGTGEMAEALKAAGAKVYCSDIEQRSYPLDERMDFTCGRKPKLRHCDGIVTNSAYGDRNKLAEAFVVTGLRHIATGGFLALLLFTDFDNASTRSQLFDRPEFVGKILLRERIVWFKRNDGKREQPRENHAWYLWQRPLLRIHRTPIVLYAPVMRP
jgi:hypothetical protein